MNHHTLKLSLLALASATLAACSSVSLENPVLAEARTAYAVAENDPRVRENAAAELMLAKSSLDRATRAQADGDKTSRVEQLAYESKQRTGIATEVAQRKSAEQQAMQANAERDRIRLEARTREADQARASAEAAQAQAVAAQGQAMSAQMQAEAAKRDAEIAQNQAADTQARNAQLVILLQELHAKQTERGIVMTISDVLFDTGRAELRPGGLRSLEKLAGLMRDERVRRIHVEGFTDSTGSQELNDALSARRAEAVRSALAGMGVSPDRITTRGLGESYPVASNDSAAGRQMNRRVEIVLSDAEGRVAQR